MARIPRLVVLIARLGLSLVALCLLYVGYAYYRYNRVPPAVHACIDCATPVTVGAYTLYYRLVGSDTMNAPVVLVHGGPGHSSLSFKNSFDFLAANRRVVYYDQRGSGNSQSTPRAADYTVEQLVDELEHLRRDVIRADRIVLIGHSFGSAIVQRYALAHPDRVEKLVIVGGIRINNGMGNRPLWKWVGPALYSTAFGLPPGDARAADLWFTNQASGDDTLRLSDKSRRSLLEGSGTVSYAAWREISLSVVGDDYRGALGRLQVPTLLLYGAADSPYTGRPAAEEICSRIPHCTTTGFAHSGHWPFLEEPNEFQRVVTEFLAR